jgi:hypothetical protein
MIDLFRDSRQATFVISPSSNTPELSAEGEKVLLSLVLSDLI